MSFGGSSILCDFRISLLSALSEWREFKIDLEGWRDLSIFAISKGGAGLQQNVGKKLSSL